MNRRKKIAVFSSNIYEPMLHSISQGINKAAAELDVKVIYFISFSDSFSSNMYNQFTLYDEGDMVAFELPDLDDFDGVIRLDLTYGTFTKRTLDDRLVKSKIPIINVGGKDDRYYNILNNEAESFCNVIEHIITEHGCEDIYHIAGIKGKYFTKERINAYRATLEKHGIPFDESKIYYGNLWKDCGEPALDYILGDCIKRGKMYPDAIVCANDYTACGLVSACRARGIEVPGDIIITGYDGVEEAFQGYPSITTGAQPFFESGYEGIYTLQKIWEGKKVPKTVLIRGRLMRKQSCGCEPMSTDSIDDIREMFQHKVEKVQYLAQSTSNLILSISGVDSMEECFSEIARNSKVDTGFDDMLLCMAPGWDKKRVIDTNFNKQDEEMSIVAGFIGDTPVKKETFRKKDILPPYLLEDKNPYYIFSIHHLQYYMGYLIVSPKIEIHEQIAMKTWLVNLGSMLENWRIRQELKETVARMEKLYNKDMLTDLYNRHGYEMFFDEYFNECRDLQLPLAVLMIDMDDLKFINDNYGHAEGDYSLCAIANAMRAAAKHEEICLRTGGDEFVVLAKNYSEEKAAQYEKDLREQIELQVKNDGKPYSVCVSVGSCIKLPPKDDNVSVTEQSEEYMKIADAAMYEQKKAHKGARILPIP